MLLWKMADILDNDSGVSAHCSSCSALTGWKKTDGLEHQIPQAQEWFWFLICSGCSRRGLAQTTATGGKDERGRQRQLKSFWPPEVQTAPLPGSVDKSLKTEFREAELCASVGAYRAASAMLRSVLEKALKLSGYNEKGSNLPAKINLASEHGILTATLKRRANENLRLLGNNVLHDEWREVKEDEFEAAHRYAQQILVALYDHRETVLETLWDNNLVPIEGPRP